MDWPGYALGQASWLPWSWRPWTYALDRHPGASLRDTARPIAACRVFGHGDYRSSVNRIGGSHDIGHPFAHLDLDRGATQQRHEDLIRFEPGLASVEAGARRARLAASCLVMLWPTSIAASSWPMSSGSSRRFEVR